MTEVTLKAFALEIQSSVDYVIKKFSDIGILKSPNDSISIQEKKIFLTRINLENNSSVNQLTVKHKTRSILNIPSSNGKSKSIKIEIRKKRTFLKPDLQYTKSSSEEDAYCVTETAINNSLELRSTYEETTKLKNLDIKQQNKVNDSKNIKIAKNSKLEKSRRENEAAKLKRKAEEEAHRKLEEEARRIAEEARRMAEENKDNWNNVSDSSEEFNDYHTTTSQHARQAEDDTDREIEGGGNRNRIRNRNTKILRQKKNSKHSESSKASRDEERVTIRSGKRKNSFLQQNFQKPVQCINRDVIIGETITISELASKMAVKGSQVIKTVMKLGAMATINQVIDQTTAQLVAEEMGHKVILRYENELEEAVMNDRDIANENAEPRAPIVTVMGHVDHGKTSLLDYIRSTKIAINEAGGITQHIGAYHVKTERGDITFLDTPGHTAFTAMRLRGVQITDIVVLVVAADDGVMPQTIEAIQHAKAAMVPIVVAINKIDKPKTDLNRVKNELSQYGVIPDEWGGDCQFICISAKTGIGINELLDAILLQAEILELKAIRKGMAKGAVIESFLDKGRGPVATVLVREGTMNKGDVILCGLEYGRIRAMRNEGREEITKAEPSIPVEVFGLSGVPEVGQEVTVVRDEKKAREVALYRQGKFREIKLSRQRKIKLENVFSKRVYENKVRFINIIIKADVQGSVEAITDALLKLSTEEVKVKIIHSGVGGITETDAVLAAASNAILVGFNIRADASSRRIIEEENIDLRYYSIIYNLIDEIKLAMNGLLSPEEKQQIIGLAEVRNVFKSQKFGAIAGCMVIEGVIKRHNPIRILRDNIVIYEGELESLRRFKDDVNEVRNGMECGLGVKNYSDVRKGDTIEMFEIVKIQRSIH